jgi:hypothetical protein
VRRSLLPASATPVDARDLVAAAGPASSLLVRRRGQDPKLIMKTMLELLIRLQEMRCCCQRVRLNPQLTKGEKAVACQHKQIVRECLPPEVLTHYDRMKTTERALRSCPELFAMAVLVATFRSLSPQGRRKLVAHFEVPPRRRSLAKRITLANQRGRARPRFNPVDGETSGAPWPR